MRSSSHIIIGKIIDDNLKVHSFGDFHPVKKDINNIFDFLIAFIENFYKNGR